jgi:hypothetical protein
MKDLAMQAYIKYLQEVIKKHEDAAELKNQLISMLEERVKLQDTLITELRGSINRISTLMGLPQLFDEQKNKDS